MLAKAEALKILTIDDGHKIAVLLFKDVVDLSPEWRFYVAEDKNASDATRCGNPINPLMHA